MDPKIFDDIAKKLSEAMPSSVKHLQEELTKNFAAVLQTAFAKLHLITREEFDVQVRVLERTRSKLETLAKQVTVLEKHLPKKPQKKPSEK